MLRKSLAGLPQTLDQTYDRILTAISAEDNAYAIRMLQWLTFSERPLTVEEIAEVVAIDVNRDPAFDRDEIFEDPSEALDICSSLVVVTTQEAKHSKPVRRIISLAHYSVQEYLVSDRIRQGQAKQYSMSKTECHSAIAMGSLKYLLQFQQLLSAENLRLFALADYAANCWHGHFEAGGEEKEAELLAMSLMSMDSPAYLNWLRLMVHPDGWAMYRFNEHPKNDLTPLCFTACLGWTAVARLLIDNGADINAQDGFFKPALHEASRGGHVQTVSMLLDKGADINAQSQDYNITPRRAIESDNKDIVEILLERGADPDDPSCRFCSIVLQEASSLGHTQIVKMLLDTGADPNASLDDWYGTALQEASAKGHDDIVRILLDHKADVNAGGKFIVGFTNIDSARPEFEEYDSALQAASVKGHYRIVKMLLDAGAQTHQENGPVPALEGSSA